MSPRPTGRCGIHCVEAQFGPASVGVERRHHAGRPAAAHERGSFTSVVDTNLTGHTGHQAPAQGMLRARLRSHHPDVVGRRPAGSAARPTTPRRSRPGRLARCGAANGSRGITVKWWRQAGADRHMTAAAGRQAPRRTHRWFRWAHGHPDEIAGVVAFLPPPTPPTSPVPVIPVDGDSAWVLGRRIAGSPTALDGSHHSSENRGKKLFAASRSARRGAVGR